jgi:hypothetical protein
MTRIFRQALERAARKADFGAVRTVSLSARILAINVDQRGDVVHVTCTAIGRVARGPSARSRISFGGEPKKRKELEREVLTLVANGLVARLSQIVRARQSSSAGSALVYDERPRAPEASLPRARILARSAAEVDVDVWNDGRRTHGATR